MASVLASLAPMLGSLVGGKEGNPIGKAFEGITSNINTGISEAQKGVRLKEAREDNYKRQQLLHQERLELMREKERLLKERRAEEFNRQREMSKFMNNERNSMRSRVRSRNRQRLYPDIDDEVEEAPEDEYQEDEDDIYERPASKKKPAKKSKKKAPVYDDEEDDDLDDDNDEDEDVGYKEVPKIYQSKFKPKDAGMKGKKIKISTVGHQRVAPRIGYRNLS